MPCRNISLYFNVLKVYGWALANPENGLQLLIHRLYRIDHAKGQAVCSYPVLD